MLFEGFCILGYREAYKILLCILMEVNKTVYGNNEDVPDKLLDIFLLSSFGIRNHMNWHVGSSDIVFPQFYQTILNKQEFIIHNSVTQLVQYSPFTMPTMSIMTNLELDGIKSKLMIASQIISIQMKLVVWYNKKKIYNTTTV
jgi:hypothetical protein